ncbi:hypothetical protein LOTGIDRAFT_169010 [Lottia gigantea]|uniref:EF-hand domain-containing protein n=1 Tax=Lottia gigantea TaxID=225164 RepID=V3YZX6_LOTGI|nr:hypothetical protein LOTGIDRAFT_169010 [Lottia gigantea]ESO83773.1 hypothetical protein LOTGIDRAFT_169010 [Lottia gigantea]
MLRLLVLSVAITVALSESISTVDVKVKTYFSAMDKDGDGQATYEELTNSVLAMDTDKNKKVIYREYAKATNADPILGRLLFNYLDSDADGHLDDDDITVTFHQFDVDHSGGISVYEFVTAFESMVALVSQAIPQVG